MHYNGASSYLFVNGVKIIKFKAKDSNIITNPLCLGNISKDWSVDNMKDTELKGYVYDFSVDYDATSVDTLKIFWWKKWYSVNTPAVMLLSLSKIIIIINNIKWQQ